MSAETTTSGCAARRCSSLSVPIAAEMPGNPTENVPPKPQHCSPSPNGTTVAPAIEPSSVSAASPLAVPREDPRAVPPWFAPRHGAPA